MDDLKTQRAATGFAIAAQFHATLQLLLLLGREVEKTECEKTGPIGQSHQQLPPSAEDDLCQLHITFNNRSVA
jgi:hypothetical protein